MSLNLGLTFADTKYRDNLVGNGNGAPLDPALRVLPGNNLSNAPEIVCHRGLHLDTEDRQYRPDRPDLRRCARDQRL